MKLQALQGLRGNYGRVRRGDLFDVPDGVAKSLINRGLAHQVGVRMGADVSPANKAAQRPLAGGRTGEDEPASSSRPARAPATRRSSASEGAPKSRA
jgi:hypothetical protein